MGKLKLHGKPKTFRLHSGARTKPIDRKKTTTSVKRKRARKTLPTKINAQLTAKKENADHPRNENDKNFNSAKNSITSAA